MTARETALAILNGIQRDNKLSDSLLRTGIDKAHLSMVDQGLVKELVSGIMRQKSKLDWILDGKLKRGIKSLNNIEANALRLGLYQIIYLDKIPPFAAVNESVELVKRFGRKEIIGLTNAVLRDIIRSKEKVFRVNSGNKINDAAIEFSHPIWLIKRWEKQLGWQETLKLLEMNNSPAPVFIRPNPSRTTISELLDQLKQGGFRAEITGLVPSAILVENPSGLVDNELFVRGCFYFQDPSAQAAALLAQAKAQDSILDLCAAPGGKASAVMAQAGGQAFLYVADINFKKLALVQENFTRLGINKFFFICGDAATLRFKKQFDLVLVDAPCTGLGVIRRRLDLRWRINESDITRLALLQRQILDNATEAVNPGGALVYSTCTVTPEENDLQIGNFLNRHPEYSIDPAEKYLDVALVQNGFMVAWPQKHQMDGAFAARLIKSR
jgi:16S rRNA (cytosine967-C5)-methyltransferase